MIPRAFLYFHETDSLAAPDGGMRLALSRVCEEGVEFRRVQSGPGGRPGLLMIRAGVIVGEGLELLQVDMERQTWREARSGSWVGFWNAARPGPLDLVRRQIPGGFGMTKCELGDGDLWAFPVLVDRRDFSSAVPTCFVDEDGAIVERPVAEFAELDAWARRLCDSMLAAQQGRPQDVLPAADVFRAAVCALTTFYRVGAAEVSVLQLMDSRVLEPVLLAMAGIGAEDLIRG